MNAKELILSKINAGPDLAGIYLHLIMLGFKFSDIYKFMTSPTVQVINDLMKVNVFDEYHESNTIDNIIRLLEEGPNIKNYVNNVQLNALYNKVKAEQGYKRKSEWIQDIKNRFESDMSVEDLIPNISFRDRRFLDEYNYLQKMKNKLNQNVFDEFKQIRKAAQETEILGRFYALNQGMPTDVAGKISRQNTYESIITNRESVYKDIRDSFDAKYFLRKVLKDKPYLDPDKTLSIIEKAVELGIVNGGFNMKKFLDPFNTIYKKVTIDYYNIIKATWNIFDMIERIPHFKALFDVYNLVDIADSNISTKFNLINESRAALIKNDPISGRTMSKEQLSTLAKYIDDILITEWLSNNNISFTLNEGEEYIGNDYNLHKVGVGGEKFNLSTDEGIANFKMWMERTVIPNLKNGIVGDRKIRNLMINKFVQGLVRNKRVDPFTKAKTVYMKLPMDMTNIKTESDKAKFNDFHKDFLALKNISLQGIPLTDLFFLYNLIVNRDEFGDDRLTALFNSYNGEDVSDLLVTYNKFIGEADYMLDLIIDTPSIEDALIRLAPIVSNSAKSRARDKYIRIWNEDRTRLLLHQKEGFDYYEVQQNLSSESLKLYDNYFVIKTPNRNTKIKELTINSSDSLSDLVNKIKSLQGRNTLQIRINC